MRSLLGRSLALASLAVLAACAAPQRAGPPTATTPPPVTATPAPVPPPQPYATARTAVEAGVTPGPALSQLPSWREADLGPALAAFRKSCRQVSRRPDPSGLTQPADWAAACAATDSDARRFFEREFTAVVIGTGQGLNTGYFEPEIEGSRTPTATASVPIYRRPSDLIEVDLGQFTESLKGRRVRGRVVNATLVPYFERAEIEDGALAGRNLELAYAADVYHLFFLHIQGSGRVRMPDGSVMRIGFDGQNGREYVGIGKRLREMNALGPGQATMDGIIAWMRANPEQGKALMRENKSYIFFRELTGEGPLGSMGVAVTPEVSVAADPQFIPLGAPLWIDTMIPEPNAKDPKGYTQTPFRRMMVAQDIGGAIKGPNRYDLFWGPGDRAAKVAGGLSWQGRAVVLLPKAAAARLLGDGTQARP
ncbi:MAG: murein transglycosylase A [Alphaproteobacteria bacterium]|nr:murein transglycosylase A [Alphaproteobacteria bacterium]